MSRLFSSFLSGVGTIVSGFTTVAPSSSARTPIDEIGSDFARVGEDISAAIEKKRAEICVRPAAADGEQKAEQLEFQGV